jgi:hypothetical protein
LIEKAGASCLPDLVTYNTWLHAWACFTAHKLESLFLGLGKSQDIFMLHFRRFNNLEKDRLRHLQEYPAVVVLEDA